MYPRSLHGRQGNESDALPPTCPGELRLSHEKDSWTHVWAGYAAWAVVVISSLKLSFLPVYLGEVPKSPLGVLYLLRLFALNGLPLLLFWLLASRCVRRNILLLVLLLAVDLFCYTSTGKVRILQEPVVFTDLFELSNAVRVRSSAAASMQTWDYLSFFDVSFPVLFWKWLGAGVSGRRAHFSRLLALPVKQYGLIVGVCAVSFAMAQHYSGPDAFGLYWGHVKFSPDIPDMVNFRNKGPLDSFLLSGYNYMTFKRDMIKNAPEKEEVRKAIEVLCATRRYPPVDLRPHGVARPNVIVVLDESMGRVAVDSPTLRAAGVDVTPFINSLDGELLFSSSILSPVETGNTAECEFVLLNSCYSQGQYGNTYSTFMDHGYRGLPKLFRERGYFCAAFHANNKEFWHRPNAYMRMGFDRYYSRYDFRRGKVVGLGLSDEDFFRQVNEKLRHLRQPYFAFIITLSGHNPFKLPEGLRSGVTRGFTGMDPFVSDYLESMNYADRQLKLFWGLTGDIRQNAVTVLCGDHQGLLKPEQFEYMGFKIEDWDDAVIRRQVPVVVSAPYLKGRLKPVRARVGDMADIAPTILDILDIPIPCYFEGQSLIRGGVTATYGLDRILDERRDFLISKDICYDYVENKQIDPNGCSDLSAITRASRVVTKDILWGNRYSYAIEKAGGVR